MKTIVNYSFFLALFLASAHLSLFAQSISGPTSVCPNTTVRYTFSPSGCSSVQWGVVQGPGTVTIIGQTATTIDLQFPQVTSSAPFRVNAGYNCNGLPTPVGNATLDVTVKVVSEISSSTQGIPCNFTGIKTFKYSLPASYGNISWTTNTNWPVASGPRITDGDFGIKFSEIDYNVNNINSGFVKLSVTSSECPNASASEHTYNITRSAVSLASPVFATEYVRFICGTSSLNVGIQDDVAGATHYVWNADISSIRINGQLPPVTLAASNGKNVTVTNTSAVQTDATISVKAAMPSCSAESATSSQTILVNKTPVANFIGGFVRDGLYFCPNNVYDFYVNSNPALTFTWSVFNGTIVYGQGTSAIGVQTKNVSGSGSISFTVKVKYSSACGDGPFFTRTGEISSQAACTFVASNADFKIGPNPAKDIITISDAGASSKEPFEVKLFDLNNVEIRETKSQGQSVINLNVRGVKTGQYILVIKKGKEKVSRHIIIL